MPARHDQQSDPPTRLGKLRIARGIKQEDLASAIGLSATTYRELESGAMANPPLRYLVNAAMALDVKLDDLIEPEWREWSRIRGGPSRPPDREALWHTAPWDEAQKGSAKRRF